MASSNPLMAALMCSSMSRRSNGPAFIRLRKDNASASRWCATGASFPLPICRRPTDRKTLLSGAARIIHRKVKREPSRSTLTRDRIVDAALDVIDRAGLDGLSMRKLGAALGVEAMALYHHVGSKERLLEAVVERLMSELDPGESADWLGV